MTEPQLYLRRCNGMPRAGIVVSRDTVASVLALTTVSTVETRGDLDTGLTVHVAAGHRDHVEAGGTVPRTFTYTPLAVGQHQRPAALSEHS
jgi:hypothetical protein